MLAIKFLHKSVQHCELGFNLQAHWLLEVNHGLTEQAKLLNQAVAKYRV